MTEEHPDGATEQAVQSKRLQIRKEMRTGEAGLRVIFLQLIIETTKSDKGKCGKGSIVSLCQLSPLPNKQKRKKLEYKNQNFNILKTKVRGNFNRAV